MQWFLISSYGDVVALGKELERTHSGLGLAIDFPQLLAQIMSGSTIDHPESQLNDLLKALKVCRNKIRAIHLWRPEKIVGGRFIGVHKEDSDGLFPGDKPTKQVFLKLLFELLNDGVERYFLPQSINLVLRKRF